MTEPTTEWVKVTDDTVIVARETGEVWFHALEGAAASALPFAQPMTGAGALGSTRGLLDGAISLGFEVLEGQGGAARPTLLGFVFSLVGAYHTSRHTSRNLRRAAARFAALGRPEVADYLEKRAREETGHDRLVLKDLAALGLPGEEIVANLLPEGVRPLAERFDRLCVEDEPIECIGYSYCLERVAALKQKADVDAVQSLCPEGVDAGRFLRSHSCLGSEVSHVEETVEFIAQLPAAERTRIVRSTHATAVLMAGGQALERRKSPAQILAELERAAGEALRIPGAEERPARTELAS